MGKIYKKKERVAIYVRVSTEKQDLQTQLSALKEYCNRVGYEIAEEYQDVISGKTDKRPGFDRMLNDMRQGKFKIILVYKLDRIGRSLQHLLNLFEEFKNNRINFVSITQNINTTTPEGKMFLRLLMILSEFEREMTVTRTKDKLDFYKRQIKTKGFATTKEGKKITCLGRPKGSKDKKRRRLSGYYNRWGKQTSPQKMK